VHGCLKTKAYKQQIKDFFMTLARVIEFSVQELGDKKIDIRLNFASSPTVIDIKAHMINEGGVIYKKLQKLGYTDQNGRPLKSFTTIIELSATEEGILPEIIYHIFEKPPSAYSPLSN